MKKIETEIVEAVLKELESRKGFDNFWNDIEPWIKREIKKDLKEKVLKVLEKRCSPE